jgi:hypothetical protein
VSAGPPEAQRGALATVAIETGAPNKPFRVSDPLGSRADRPEEGGGPKSLSRRGTTGTGEDEIAALRHLDGRLRGVPQPDSGPMDELRRRRRLAYVEEAEEWSRHHAGRSLTADEIAGIVARFRG